MFPFAYRLYEDNWGPNTDVSSGTDLVKISVNIQVIATDKLKNASKVLTLVTVDLHFQFTSLKKKKSEQTNC